MQRIAVLSDIHGNATALAAVLADAKAQHVNEYWTVGDVAVRGPESEKCLQLLETVHPTAAVLGNHEQNYRKVLKATAENFTKPKQVMATILTAYDYAQLTSTHFDQLLHLPMTVTKHVGPLTIRLQHVLPNFASGHTMAPTEAQLNFDQAASGNPDIVIYAHTHQPVMRYSTRGQLILNAGTVGLPTAIHPALRQPRAMYLILTIDETGVQAIDYRHVDFDVDAAVAIAHEKQLPYLPFYKRTLRTNTYQYAPQRVADYNAAHGLDAQAQAILKTTFN
ncbi:metallophosphoesterase family protein [Lactiplantibacillus fabifermentans]|uniref:Metallo-phosphoesterase n=1 Tax=Lactiplantibacillus fabifermentans DSM 21115 TaxID=1413187 RepID=A0A0R2NJX5_9LACO|nr:metallophosphoesterase family protein [Lactiplantibacillus fabifermentans]KRO26094.1 metallo-phosphoesterase [Lactiplantibacillus fabifermentans DSM 21115]